MFHTRNSVNPEFFPKKLWEKITNKTILLLFIQTVHVPDRRRRFQGAGLPGVLPLRMAEKIPHIIYVRDACIQENYNGKCVEL